MSNYDAAAWKLYGESHPTLEKSASDGVESKPIPNSVLETAAVGSVGALFAMQPTVYVQQIPNTNKVTVYYSDPRRGAGHFAQAKALVQSLKKQGADVHLVNFDMEFAKRTADELERDAEGNFLKTPQSLLDYNATYEKWFRNPTDETLNGHFAAHHKFYKGQLDAPKLNQAFATDERKVLTNIGLQGPVNRLGKPVFLLHTDQHPWEWVESESAGSLRHLHIAPKTSADILRVRNPEISDRLVEISDLPIMPAAAKKPPYARAALQGAGAHNVTVSGGNLGMNVAHAVEDLIGSGKLPSGTVIHAVAGKDPTTLGVLKRLEEATKGATVKVRAYGFAPLREMMAEADINVLNPNGTSITEATAAGKPLVLYLPPDGARAMDKNNVTTMAGAHGTLVGTSYKGADIAAAKPKHVGEQVALVLENYAAHHEKAKSLSAAASSGADQAAQRILGATNIPATRNPAMFKPMARLAARHLTNNKVGGGTLLVAAGKAAEYGLSRMGARAALGATAIGATGVLAHRLHTQNPEILSTFKDGLMLLPSKTNAAVRRWQGDEHEKAAEEKRDWKGNAVGAATGLGAAALMAPATVLGDSVVMADKKKTTPMGSIQKLTKAEGDLAEQTLSNLSDQQIGQLQRDHVVQWLTSDHDAHKHNVLKLPGGNLFSIDKGNAFRFLGKDQLKPGYRIAATPYYQGQLKDYMAGGLKDVNIAGPKNNPELKAFIHKIQDMPDAQFLGHFEPFIKASRREGFPQDMSEQEFVSSLLKRKKNLSGDFHKFYDEVDTRRAASVGTGFKPAARVQPSVTGSIPDDLLKTQKMPWKVEDFKPTLKFAGGSRSHPKSMLRAPDGSIWMFKEAPEVVGPKGGSRIAAVEHSISRLSHDIGHPAASVHGIHIRVPYRTSLPQKALLTLGAGVGAGVLGKKLYDKVTEGKPKHASAIPIIPVHMAASYWAEIHELKKVADSERDTNTALGVGAAGSALAIPAMMQGDAIVRSGKGGSGTYGSIQKLLPNKGQLGQAKLEDLTDAQIKSLQKEHALSWLMSEWDSHGGNILKTPDEGLMGIDKGQALRYMGKDKLEIGYRPERYLKSYFHGQLKNYSEGGAPGVLIQGPKHNPELKAFLKKIQDLPDDEYEKLLEPYAAAAEKEGRLGDLGGKAGFHRVAKERKNNIIRDMDNLYGEVHKRRSRTGAGGAARPGIEAKSAPVLPHGGDAPDVNKMRATTEGLGGYHKKVVLRAPDGSKFMFKPKDWMGDSAVEAERIANQVANVVGHPSAEVHTLHLRQPFKTPAAAKILAGGAALGMGGLLAHRTLGKDKSASVLLPHTVAAYWAERAEIEKTAWNPLPTMKGAYKAVGGAITNASRAVPLPVIEGAQRFITGAAATGGSPAAMLGYGTATAMTSLAPRAAKAVAAPLGRAVQAAGYPTAARTVQKQVTSLGHVVDRWGQHANGLEFAT